MIIKILINTKDLQTHEKKKKSISCTFNMDMAGGGTQTNTSSLPLTGELQHQPSLEILLIPNDGFCHLRKSDVLI